VSAWSRKTCAECGAKLTPRGGRGRPPDYCDEDCRNAVKNRKAREKRRALLEELQRLRAEVVHHA